MRTLQADTPILTSRSRHATQVNWRMALRHRAMTRIAPVAFVTIAYTILTIGLTWPLATHLNRGVTSPIDPVDSIWRVGWGQYRLLHNPLHLFTGNTFYPFPSSYLFDELVLGAAIMTLPLAVLHVAPLAIYNLAVLLSIVTSALAMYALARRFGAVRAAAFIAGMIFAFAPMHLDHIGHLGLLSAQWFPLILLFCDRLVMSPRPREAAALAACLVMQAISSQYYAIYLILLVPLFVSIVVIRRPEARRLTMWIHLVAAGAVAMLIVAPFAVGYRHVQTEYGVERTFGQTTHYAANVTSFFTADGRNRLWGTITSPVRAAGAYTFERNMFPGLLALVLAMIGFWYGRRRPWEQFLAALVVLSGVLALGPELRLTPESKSLLLRHLPYDILYWHLPGWDSMRVPARFGILFLLGIAGLAGTGATALIRRCARLKVPRARYVHAVPAVVAALLVTGCGIEYVNHPLPITALESGETIPPVYQWLAGEPDARILELPLMMPDHERDQAIAAREQYYALSHLHPMINGNANVLPKGYKALVLEMKRFPSERSVALLQGLGITHIVVHFDQMPNRAGEALAERLGTATDGLGPAIQFGPDSVFRVTPSAHLAELAALVAPGEPVRLSREDPLGTGAYMGMIGYVLRDHPLYARLRVAFGQHYAGEPDDSVRYNYGVLYSHEDPASAGFADADVIWQDSVVRLYHRRGP